ncbi:MAG: TorF family putative porin [Steroidobacteraceae bacterium]
MKFNKSVLALPLLAAAAGMAHAEVTGTITAVSDYDFRGQTQSSGDPALQGSIDWAGETGLSAGIWASTVDFGPGTDSDIEIDLYAGYEMSLSDDLSWNIGGVYYLYQGDGDDVDYLELSTGLGYKDFSTKLWFSPDFVNSDESAWYIEANYSFALPQDFSLDLHAGYNFGDYWKLAGGEYFDYSIGVSKSLGNFDLALKFIDGSDYAPGDYSRSLPFSSKNTVVFSIGTTLPWGE